MELKSHMQEANRKEEKDIDKYIAERDKEDYEKYLVATEERRRWQKNMMNQEYNNSIALRKAMQEHEKLLDKNGNPLNTLKGVGDNYEMQLMKQKRVEDAQKQMQDNYQRNVHDPQMQRLLAEKEREAKDYAEVKARFDREKEFLEAQKNQAKKLNYLQLQMQKQE